MGRKLCSISQLCDVIKCEMGLFGDEPATFIISLSISTKRNLLYLYPCNVRTYFDVLIPYTYLCMKRGNGTDFWCCISILSVLVKYKKYILKIYIKDYCTCSGDQAMKRMQQMQAKVQDVC